MHGHNDVVQMARHTEFFRASYGVGSTVLGQLVIETQGVQPQHPIASLNLTAGTVACG